MITIIDKDAIIKNATKVLSRQAGITFALVKRQGGRVVVAQVGDAEVRLHPEVKTKITKAGILLTLTQGIDRPQDFLLITNQVTDEIAEKLRCHGIQFIDEAGNAFINKPPIYVFIKGQKNPDATGVTTIGRAFKQTGLRVLYAFLCNPGMENETYRMIAGKTGVALGMVDWTMRELRELGFLIEMGTGRTRNARITNKVKLLERWVTAYTEQLRPKLFLGRYRGADGWWENANLNPDQGLWGGEVAAAHMTGYLKPEDVIVYVPNETQAKILAQFRLKKDPQGNVEFYSCFWKPETVVPHGNMVHPLLVYADLVATGDQRNLETARMVYDQYLVQFIGKD